MSPAIVIALLALSAYLFSQFGGRLSARNSLVWWIALLVLLLAAISPDSLQPLSHALGIQLVSNLVLGAMVVFLFLQAVQENTISTTQGRRLRELVCALAAREFQAPIRRDDPAEIRALIIVPCYNEANSLPNILPKLQEVTNSIKGVHLDFCIVNDGSRDESGQILDRLASAAHVDHSINVGVSGALLTGFKVVQSAGYDYAVQCDADGQHPIESIPELVLAAHKRKYDLTIGSRFRSAAELSDPSTTRMRRIGSILIVGALRLFRTSKLVSDPTSGFRVYSRRACAYLAEIMPDEYPEPESIALLSLARARIGEAPVKMAPRTTGVSSLAGLSGITFMLKVLTALLGLRIRSFTRVGFQRKKLVTIQSP